MKMMNDIVSYEYLIPLCVIVLVSLPLLPNKKLRYYTCYVCYIFGVSLLCLILMPIALLRPRDIVNLKIAGSVARYITVFLGIEWKLRNGDILKKERGAVIVANHQSILDVMGMFNIWDIMDKVTAVAKKELLYAAPFGPLAWLGGLVFIDRVNPKEANNKLQAVAHALIKKKAKLWLFPEGTRNKKGNCILPFKNGAFRVAIETQVPIIPVVYSPYYFIDSKSKTFSDGKIIISTLDPVPTDGLTLKDLDQLKQKIHRIMSAEYENLKKEITSFRCKNRKIRTFNNIQS